MGIASSEVIIGGSNNASPEELGLEDDEWRGGGIVLQAMASGAVWEPWGNANGRASAMLKKSAGNKVLGSCAFLGTGADA